MGNKSMNIHRIVNDADLPAPLPLRVPPCNDEDLLSVLRRSAARMGYPDVRWLLRPARGNWFLDEADIPLLSAEEDYRALGSLLRLSREELHSHTLHRFARLLESGESPRQPPGQDHTSTHLPQMNPGLREAYFLPVRSLRICPLCLREPVCYDRLYWRMRLMFYCPQHRVRLLEKCPSCKAPIPASRPSPYTCPRCQHGDYRSVDTTPLSPENPLYLGERLLLGALGFELPSDEKAARSLASSPLPTLTGASYLNLLKAVTLRLEALFSERELFLLIQYFSRGPHISRPSSTPGTASQIRHSQGGSPRVRLPPVFCSFTSRSIPTTSPGFAGPTSNTIGISATTPHASTPSGLL